MLEMLVETWAFFFVLDVPLAWWFSPSLSHRVAFLYTEVIALHLPLYARMWYKTEAAVNWHVHLRFDLFSLTAHQRSS